MSGRRRILHRRADAVPEEPKTEEQPEPEVGKGEARGRVRFPEADLHGVLVGISRDLADGLADYGYKSRTEGSPEASAWLEIRARDLWEYAIGTVGVHYPGLIERAEREYAKVQHTRGLNYYFAVRRLTAELISSVMFGKERRGISVDEGGDEIKKMYAGIGGADDDSGGTSKP